jgi:phage-related minor tail protein
MRGGQGLMGEAGPEAIMPLARGADGRLGVQAAGGGRAVNVVMNVTTPDVQGFQRSQGQIAAQAARALARGQRNR